MDALEFLGLEPTPDPNHWRLPVVPRICSGIGALFGGCALGSAVAVLEARSERNLVWVTAQYLSFATPPSVLDLHISESVRGHQISQATLTATVDDTPVFTAIAALGSRETPWSGDFTTMPAVPTPEHCGPRSPSPRWKQTFQSLIDARIADARDLGSLDGTPGSGRASMWVRLRDLELSPTSLAVLADYVPWGVGQALGLPVGGNSLDNTLRITHRPTKMDQSGWLLVDVHIATVADGFAHGRVHLWSEAGQLLATATQSIVIREWDQPPPPRRISGAADSAQQPADIQE